MSAVAERAVSATDAVATRTEAAERSRLLRRAMRLEYITVLYNLAEGVVSIAAALAAGSVALLGFGIDSFVESSSGAVLIWRLLAERRATSPEHVERIERRAQRLVAVSLLLLAAYVAWDTVASLAGNEHPEPSLLGVVVALCSLATMPWLARAKRRVGIGLSSLAMTADAFQTDACFLLSLCLLVGVGANALLGFWWADQAAALGMVVFIAREGLETWHGEDE